MSDHHMRFRLIGYIYTAVPPAAIAALRGACSATFLCLVPEEEGALPEAVTRTRVCSRRISSLRAADLADRRDRSRGYSFPCGGCGDGWRRCRCRRIGSQRSCLGFDRKMPRAGLFDALGDALLLPAGNGDTLWPFCAERSWLTCDFFEGLLASLVALTALLPTCRRTSFRSTTTLAQEHHCCCCHYWYHWTIPQRQMPSSLPLRLLPCVVRCLFLLLKNALLGHASATRGA